MEGAVYVYKAVANVLTVDAGKLSTLMLLARHLNASTYGLFLEFAASL